MFVIDSHCHLAEIDNLPEVIKRANEAFVIGMLSISTSSTSIAKNIKIANDYNNIWATVGIHPHYISDIAVEKIYDLLKNNLSDKKVIGIGETGLDETGDISLQRLYFKEHIKIAVENGLPLIIHSRNTDREILEELHDYKYDITGVFHCYTGSIEFAKKILDYGFYISASGIITFKNGINVREVFKYLPLDRILIETDAPWLAPVPYRGKKNESSYIIETFKCLSEIRNISIDDLANITTNNFKKLFKVDIIEYN